MGDEGDLVASRLARGCQCFVIWIDGAIGAYGWLSTGPEWIGEIQLEIKPREPEAYIWNCVTIPEHRRRGLFASLVSGITSAAMRNGSKRLWIGSIAIPAEKTLATLGFLPALHFHYTTLAGLHLMRVRSDRERALARDACSALGVRLGWLVRASQPKRH